MTMVENRNKLGIYLKLEIPTAGRGEALSIEKWSPDVDALKQKRIPAGKHNCLIHSNRNSIIQILSHLQPIGWGRENYANGGCVVAA